MMYSVLFLVLWSSNNWESCLNYSALLHFNMPESWEWLYNDAETAKRHHKNAFDSISNSIQSVNTVTLSVCVCVCIRFETFKSLWHPITSFSLGPENNQNMANKRNEYRNAHTLFNFNNNDQRYIQRFSVLNPHITKLLRAFTREPFFYAVQSNAKFEQHEKESINRAQQQQQEKKKKNQSKCKIGLRIFNCVTYILECLYAICSGERSTSWVEVSHHKAPKKLLLFPSPNVLTRWLAAITQKKMYSQRHSFYCNI